MLHRALIGLAAVAVPGVAVGQAPLSLEDLNAFAEEARNFKSRDQFDFAPPQRSLAGVRFSYVVEPMPLDQKPCSGYPDWSFQAAQGKLNVGWYSGTLFTTQLRGAGGPIFPPNLRDRGRSELTYRAFTCRTTKLPSYTATNALGAAFTIEKSVDTVAAIADFVPMTLARRPPSSWEAAVTGDAARLLSRNVRLRVSGTLNDWAPGKSVVCGAQRLEPRITLPIDRTTEVCLIRGQITLVELFDQTSNRVLHSQSYGPDQSRDRR